MSSSPKSKCKKQTDRDHILSWSPELHTFCIRLRLHSAGCGQIRNTGSLLLSVPDNLWLDENSHQGAKIWNFSYNVITLNYFEENRNFYTS